MGRRSFPETGRTGQPYVAFMMPVVDVITRMQELNGSLSDREQRVADYILENLEAVAYQNQNEIALATSVSEATVTRFCQRIGCDGFRDFRVRFAQSVAVSLPYLRASQLDGDENVQLADLVDQVFGSAASLLALARNQLSAKSLGAAIDILASARRIAFIGVGGSSSNLAAKAPIGSFVLVSPRKATPTAITSACWLRLSARGTPCSRSRRAVARRS